VIVFFFISVYQITSTECWKLHLRHNAIHGVIFKERTSSGKMGLTSDLVISAVIIHIFKSLLSVSVTQFMQTYFCCQLFNTAQLHKNPWN